MEKQSNIIPIIVIIIIVLLAGITLFYVLVNKTNTYLAHNSKIDKTKELVHRAGYTSELDNTSYTSDITEEEYTTGDIVVPYININSDDVNKINTEIKSLYDEFISVYSESFNTPWYIKTNYETYINKDILSVLLESEIGGTDAPIENYYAFNVNLKDLSKMNYEDIYHYAKFSEEDINKRVEKAISEYIDTLDKIAWNENERKEDYIRQSIQNYYTDLNDNSLQYFINKNNKLTDIIEIAVPAGSGDVAKLIIIE